MVHSPLACPQMFYFFAILAMLITGTLLLLVLFEPGLEYQIKTPKPQLDSEEFRCLLGALADAQIHEDSHVEVLANGNNFYEAELAAIRQAKRSINMEAYIFRK